MEIHYMTVLWGIVPSVASKHSSCAPSAMPPPDPTDPITALTAALVQLLPNQPLISLVTPSFDWNTMEQYDYFQLFHKSVESWFTLQNIPAETPGDSTAETNSTRLEYVLNFLGNTGCQEVWPLEANWHSWWDCERRKSKTTAFMDYLSSMMDHAVSQHCRIYQLEDVCIWPGESPDELIDHLWALADWCNFPDRRGKGMEHPVQIHQSPKWQGTCQEAASPWSDSNNNQDAWSVLTHTLPSQTTSRPCDWRNTRQSMPYGGKPSHAPRKKTSSRQCTLLWTLHKVPPTLQIIMPSKGWPLLRMWKIRTLEA